MFGRGAGGKDLSTHWDAPLNYMFYLIVNSSLIAFLKYKYPLKHTFLSKNMESLHQIIATTLEIINLLQIKIYRCYKNIFISIKIIKFKPLIYRFNEDQDKIYLSGEIYQ